MATPVYLFTGFMDSGKTSLIQETLFENDFGENPDIRKRKVSKRRFCECGSE